MNLHNASKNKKDEFYTQLPDIEHELNHYREHLKGKVIFCNCDDPELSNFWKYFHLNFEKLGIKKLISTHFVYEDIFQKGETYKLEYEGGNDSDIMVGVKTILIENGDFRSKECVEILEKSDIVITNPPFSLFREYVGQLVEHKKKFVIIGHQNAITYKEVFKLIKENKIWLGYGFNGGAAHFINKHYEDYATAGNHKEGMIRVSGVVWFTNLDISKRHEDLILYKKYNKNDYQKYENYKAINVDTTKEIPTDYDGAIGVPITFLNKYNPEQFEIIGLGISNSGIEIGVKPYKEEHKKYRKEVQQRGAVDGDLYMIKDGIVDVPYARILIKKKEK